MHIVEVWGETYGFRVVNTLYLDYGLAIYKMEDGEWKEIFYNPSCLSSDVYGTHYEDEEGNELEEGIPWSEEDWAEYFRSDAATLIEAYAP